MGCTHQMNENSKKKVTDIILNIQYLLSVCFSLFSNYLFFLFKDILENDDIVLDLVFKNSLMMDLAEVSIKRTASTILVTLSALWVK